MNPTSSLRFWSFEYAGGVGDSSSFPSLAYPVCPAEEELLPTDTPSVAAWELARLYGAISSSVLSQILSFVADGTRPSEAVIRRATGVAGDRLSIPQEARAKGAIPLNLLAGTRSNAMHAGREGSPAMLVAHCRRIASEHPRPSLYLFPNHPSRSGGAIRPMHDLAILGPPRECPGLAAVVSDALQWDASGVPLPGLGPSSGHPPTLGLDRNGRVAGHPSRSRSSTGGARGSDPDFEGEVAARFLPSRDACSRAAHRLSAWVYCAPNPAAIAIRTSPLVGT